MKRILSTIKAWFMAMFTVTQNEVVTYLKARYRLPVAADHPRDIHFIYVQELDKEIKAHFGRRLVDKKTINAAYVSLDYRSVDRQKGTTKSRALIFKAIPLVKL